MELDFFKLFRFSEVILKFAQNIAHLIWLKVVFLSHLHMPFLPQLESYYMKNCTWKCLEQFTLTLLSFA